MRDVAIHQTQTVYNAGLRWSPKWVGTDVDNTFSGQVTSIDRGRADLKKGDHIHPTAYHAHDIRIHANWFDIRRTRYYRGYFFNHGWTNYSSEEFYTGRKSLTSSALASYLGLGYGGKTPNVTGSVKRRCRNKALTKLKRQEASLGATLGEITELRGMMINKFTLLIRCFLLVKRGKANEALALMRLQKQKALGSPHLTFANAWLALELGWKPLMQEIFGLQEAIKNIADNRELDLRVTAVVEQERPMGWFSDYSLSGSLIEGCQIGIVAKMDPQFPGWLRRLGAGNPVSIAWELTTLSFVVDWFVNVGNFLNLLDATHSLKFVSAYETTFVKGKGTLTQHWGPLGPESALSKAVYPSWDFDIFTMKRDPGTEFPNAQITLGDGLSNTWRRLTSLALVASRTGDKIKPIPNWSYSNRPIYRGRRLKTY